jgi:hypothetical protein
MNRSVIQYLTEGSNFSNKDKLATSVFDWLKRIGSGGSVFTPTRNPNKKPQDLPKKLPEKSK